MAAGRRGPPAVATALFSRAAIDAIEHHFLGLAEHPNCQGPRCGFWWGRLGVVFSVALSRARGPYINATRVGRTMRCPHRFLKFRMLSGPPLVQRRAIPS